MKIWNKNVSIAYRVYTKTVPLFKTLVFVSPLRNGSLWRDSASVANASLAEIVSFNFNIGVAGSSIVIKVRLSAISAWIRFLRLTSLPLN